MATANLTTLSTAPASHLQAAEWGFAALSAAPACLAMDCAALSAAAAGHDLGLPSGTVSLSVLRDWLMANPGKEAARDAVWRELVLRARLDGGQWRLAAVGMALPGLRRHARVLSAGYRGDAADMDAEVLTGFLTGLDGKVDLAKPAPFAALLGGAFKAGHRLRAQADPAEPVEDIDAVAAGPRVPRRPYGHPDLLVHRAAQLRIINPDDEEPFITVRLAGKAIEPVAARLGITVDCLRRRLDRAGERLAVALAKGRLTGTPMPEADTELAAKKRHPALAALTHRLAPPMPVAV
ncbi:hypothetical protein [Actinoplanes couchii]|uniref:Uncharacterized protein n=1 Tax=Actinoplanes couchii TaxID=403638 RepID=A0ABQ3XST1_9ACTN|nr:hypothetical protein [Actinoplanes couchii]MDR6324044.1 DNA-directed RNA polymerase specialized sigma24 family protein [Actinoplanes couchii]GID61571.1 hypothetical protein Aco03nite_099750 [Actinoplanes couchii]